MSSIRCWEDLSAYGIVPLSDETYGQTRYILCKVTPRGKRTLEKTLGVAKLPLQKPGNRTRRNNPYLGTILLAPGLLPVVGIYALLDDGCREVWLTKDYKLIGIRQSDIAAKAEHFVSPRADNLLRRYTYSSTAGDGIKEVMTGWIH